MRTITPSSEDFLLPESPWYRATADEVEVFETAWRTQLPVLLKGPTGCGKTRFVAHMAHKLGRPLVTVACHEDLTAAEPLWRENVAQPLAGNALRHG